MNHIEVLKAAFSACSKAECKAIINAPNIACGKEIDNDNDNFIINGKPTPEIIIKNVHHKNTLDYEWIVFDLLCDAAEEVFIPKNLLDIPYLAALKNATQADVKQAAKLALKGKE